MKRRRASSSDSSLAAVQLATGGSLVGIWAASMGLVVLTSLALRPLTKDRKDSSGSPR